MHFLFDVMKPSYNYSGTHFNSHFEKSSVRYRCYRAGPFALMFILDIQYTRCDWPTLATSLLDSWRGRCGEETATPVAFAWRSGTYLSSNHRATFKISLLRQIHCYVIWTGPINKFCCESPQNLLWWDGSRVPRDRRNDKQRTTECTPIQILYCGPQDQRWEV